MRKLLKWTGLSVLGLLAATLLLVLAWVASNWHDADPQPIPAALAAPPAKSGEGGLLATLAAAPRANDSLSWPPCKGSDCAAVWAAKTTDWAQWQQAHAALGTACQAALQAPTLSLGEPLPADWSPNTELPAYLPLTNCHRWLLSAAWQAGQRDDGPAMLDALQQAGRLERLLRDESRLLIGQMVGMAMTGRRLMLITALAPRFPAQREAMADLADLPAPSLMAAMRRWVPAEAAFGRGMVAQLHPEPAAAPTQGDASDTKSWQTRLLGRLLARFSHPEATRQLFDGLWLRTLDCLKYGVPQAAADCLRATTQVVPGPLPGGLRWRHTVPHVLHDTAKPAWSGYMDRAVDVHHAAQVTQAWLRGQPPTAAVDTAADGTWTLRLRDAGQTHRLPTQWAPLPKDR